MKEEGVRLGAYKGSLEGGEEELAEVDCCAGGLAHDAADSGVGGLCDCGGGGGCYFVCGWVFGCAGDGGVGFYDDGEEELVGVGTGVGVVEGYVVGAGGEGAVGEVVVEVGVEVGVGDGEGGPFGEVILCGGVSELVLELLLYLGCRLGFDVG